VAISDGHRLPEAWRMPTSMSLEIDSSRGSTPVELRERLSRGTREVAV
jgi:hypothetical protein